MFLPCFGPNPRGGQYWLKHAIARLTSIPRVAAEVPLDCEIVECADSDEAAATLQKTPVTAVITYRSLNMEC